MIKNILVALIFLSGLSIPLYAQTEKPISNEEFVRMLYQLPSNPRRKELLIEEIRKRGIDFELTSGLRSLVTTKSGNDALLRRTLEEAARRRIDPVSRALPSEAEANKFLEQAKVITLEITETMPDFVVKQLITRSHALGRTRNWTVGDHLTVAVSYHVKNGEQYKLLAINGISTGKDEGQNSYEDVGGTSSTGEFVSMLKYLFADETKAKFKMVDTDTVRDNRAIIYEYEVEKENSKQRIVYNKSQETIVGYKGRVWIDRESSRVLRIESICTEIPPDFPVTAASKTVDYDWVKISEKKYLLPSNASVEMTAKPRDQIYQSRNEIRFRNYQKYGSEVKIIEDEEVPEGTNP
jgi:hypothetical protein